MAVRVVIFASVLGLVAFAACAVSTADPEPTTPSPTQTEPAAEPEMVRALEDLAAKAPPKAEPKHGKPALGEPPSPEKMCSRGRCPSGYRCGAVAGRPRKVCYAAEAHRAGPTGMFKP